MRGENNLTKIAAYFIYFCLILFGCGNPKVSVGTVTLTLPTPSQTSPQEPSFTPSATVTPTHSPTASVTSTATPTPTNTPTITFTITHTPIPTYVRLRGKVIIEQAVCHYGPGKPYLYKYGVYAGSNLEIIGRDPAGNYIEVQAIGGNNPCWVNAAYMEIKGDLANVQPIQPDDVKLPMSPYYSPPTGVFAQREGNEVTVSWNALELKPGDDSEQVPYVVEAWICMDGQLSFNPLGSYTTVIKIIDEPGCTELSRGRLFAAEKHGYTRWVTIPWPPANQAIPSSISPVP